MWTPDDDDRAEIARLISESQRPAPDGWMRPADGFVASEEPGVVRGAMHDADVETMAGMLLVVAAVAGALGMLIGYLLALAVT